MYRGVLNEFVRHTEDGFERYVGRGAEGRGQVGCRNRKTSCARGFCTALTLKENLSCQPFRATVHAAKPFRPLSGQM